ncbi:hypothetical protein [Lentzea sp. NPDC060358]|uniref:hypothetical protein n=1 Tax=Lentzea sp. NPDC060358 TaxID=3347103 RepID=UPI00364CC864
MTRRSTRPHSEAVPLHTDPAPRRHPPHPLLLDLQRAAGNAAVCRALAPGTSLQRVKVRFSAEVHSAVDTDDHSVAGLDRIRTTILAKYREDRFRSRRAGISKRLSVLESVLRRREASDQLSALRARFDSKFSDSHVVVQPGGAASVREAWVKSIRRPIGVTTNSVLLFPSLAATASFRARAMTAFRKAQRSEGMHWIRHHGRLTHSDNAHRGAMQVWTGASVKVLVKPDGRFDAKIYHLDAADGGALVTTYRRRHGRAGQPIRLVADSGHVVSLGP